MHKKIPHQLIGCKQTHYPWDWPGISVIVALTAYYYAEAGSFVSYHSLNFAGPIFAGLNVY